MLATVYEHCRRQQKHGTEKVSKQSIENPGGGNEPPADCPITNKPQLTKQSN
jgi:hypothetical protein